MSIEPKSEPMGCPAGLKARPEVYSVNPTLPSKFVVSDEMRKPYEVVVRVKVMASIVHVWHRVLGKQQMLEPDRLSPNPSSLLTTCVTLGKSPTVWASDFPYNGNTVISFSCDNKIDEFGIYYLLYGC